MRMILCVSENEKVFDWAQEALRAALIDDEPLNVLCAHNLRWPGMPACVLLDPKIGARRGYVVLQQTRLTYPNTPVIVLLGSVIDNYLNEADAIVRCFAPMRDLFSALVGVSTTPARTLSEHPSYPPPTHAISDLLLE